MSEKQTGKNNHFKLNKMFEIKDEQDNYNVVLFILGAQHLLEWMFNHTVKKCLNLNKSINSLCNWTELC